MPPETKIIPKRGSWSPQEDQRLLELVEGAKSVRWVNIAELLGTRTSKQCRERYHQNLKPTLNHTPITPEEGRQIDHLVTIYGKRWAEISRHLKGRSDNAIKNWWNASANRRKSQSWGNSMAHVPGGPGSFYDRVSVSGPSGPLGPMGPMGPHMGPSGHIGAPELVRSGSISGPLDPGMPESAAHSRQPSIDMGRRHSEFQPRAHSISAGAMPSIFSQVPQAHGQPQVPAQVGVVFNPSYQETYTPPSAAVLPSVTPTSSQSPLLDSGPTFGTHPLPLGGGVPPNQVSSGPTLPPPAHMAANAPPSAHSSGPAFYPSSHHQTPYSRRDSRRESRLEAILDQNTSRRGSRIESILDSRRESRRESRRGSCIESLLDSRRSSRMEPSRMDPRLPAIGPFLEEQFRTLRRQSHDSNDLLRYSLSVESRPPSPPELRRSSVAYPPGYAYDDSPREISPLPGFHTPTSATPTRSEN